LVGADVAGPTPRPTSPEKAFEQAGGNTQVKGEIVKRSPSGPDRSRHDVNRSVGGFTLIELMIVVAVVAILAAIAYPSYIDSVRKSRRSDAKNALHAAASREEQYYGDNKAYNASMTALGYTSDPADSPEKYYKISVDNSLLAGCAIATCYVLKAVPQGDQAKDTHCGTLTVDSKGNKTGNSTDCW
jgi:type IV pilus assembly protein PilE